MKVATTFLSLSIITLTGLLLLVRSPRPAGKIEPPAGSANQFDDLAIEVLRLQGLTLTVPEPLPVVPVVRVKGRAVKAAVTLVYRRR